MYSFFLFHGVNIATGGFNYNYVFCSLIACRNRSSSQAVEVPIVPFGLGTKKRLGNLVPSRSVENQANYGDTGSLCVAGTFWQIGTAFTVVSV